MTVAVARPATASACTGVNIVVVRGTGEWGNVGFIMPAIANAIHSAFPDSTIYGLPYAAGYDIFISAARGTTMLVDYLESSVASCPSQQYVLIGYSQGAMVVGDAIVSSSLSSDAKAMIGAVLLFGNPYRTAGESFNVGTAGTKVGGMFPRAKGAFSAYADILQDYCDSGDPFCARGGNIFAHLGYGSYSSKAVAFLQGL